METENVLLKVVVMVIKSRKKWCASASAEGNIHDMI